MSHCWCQNIDQGCRCSVQLFPTFFKKECTLYIVTRVDVRVKVHTHDTRAVGSSHVNIGFHSEPIFGSCTLCVSSETKLSLLDKVLCYLGIVLKMVGINSKIIEIGRNGRKSRTAELMIERLGRRTTRWSGCVRTNLAASITGLDNS